MITNIQIIKTTTIITIAEKIIIVLNNKMEITIITNIKDRTLPTKMICLKILTNITITFKPLEVIVSITISNLPICNSRIPRSQYLLLM